MMPEPQRIEPGSGREERMELLRDVISRESTTLIRSLCPIIRSIGGFSSAEAVLERAADVFNEAVEIALSNADRYDPERSAYAWIKGIAINVLRGTRRDAARERGRVARQADLGDRWEIVLQIADRREDATEDRMDVRDALDQLDPDSRHALVSRYFRGLDGQELADAIGAPTPGAARVRLVRARQKLERLLPPPEPEVRR